MEKTDTRAAECYVSEMERDGLWICPIELQKQKGALKLWEITWRNNICCLKLQKTAILFKKAKWIWEKECKWIHCYWGRKKLYKSRVPTHRRAKQNDAYRTTGLSTMDSHKFIKSCSTRRWKCTMRSMMIDGTSTNASGQKSEECSSN